MKVEIKNRWTGLVIHSADVTDDTPIDKQIRSALLDAVSKKINLSGSNLSGSDLRGSNLSGSNLSGSNLSGSDLRGSNLSDSNLRGSDLRDSNLTPIKNDFFNVLLLAPFEILGLESALREGRVNGSTYEGDCACLVGTIANVAEKNYRALGTLKPDANRLIERFFLNINKGDTPETNQFSALAVQWIEEFKSLIASHVLAAKKASL